MNNQEKFEKIFALTVEVKAKESGTGTEINIPTEWWDAEYKPKQCQHMSIGSTENEEAICQKEEE